MERSGGLQHFALERLSVRCGEDGRIARIRYVLPRHKAANCVGQGRWRKSTRPGVNGVVKIWSVSETRRVRRPWARFAARDSSLHL
jgi:hypothetical protein